MKKPTGNGNYQLAKRDPLKINLRTFIVMGLSQKYKKERIHIINYKQNVLKDSYYITHTWMPKDLKLKGVELYVFAIIYGYCRDGEGLYYGSRRNLAQLCRCSTRGIDKALKRLIEKNLIEKKSWYDDLKQKKCTYTINFSKVDELIELNNQRTEFTGGPANSVHGGVRTQFAGGCEHSSHNNIALKNRNNNTLSDGDDEVKQYGRFGNVRLTAYWYDYLTVEAEDWYEEYINRLDMHLEKKGLKNKCKYWPPERFGLTILDWMRRDGVTSD